MAVSGRLALPLVALLLAGCGYQSGLTRLPPASGPDANRAAQRAAERAEVRRGLELAPTAQPQRVDDLTVKLDQRPEDPFALPPAGTRGATPTPFPGDPPMDGPVDETVDGRAASDAATKGTDR